MDALDIQILREFGMEPFVRWAERPRGLRVADVARKLHVGEQLVKERVTRMTDKGVITGYRLMPNLRHCGQEFTVHHLRDATVPSKDRVARLADVDGFSRVVWFLDSGLCINLSHGTEQERGRRIQLLARLVEADRPAGVLYTIDLPPVKGPLSDLDWRIIRALVPDAKRNLSEVAEELGVTTKTVRSRLGRMRDEGSIDEYLALDFSKLEGIIPFQLALWCPPELEAMFLARYRDRYLAHFRPGGDDPYCTLLFRIFAYTPAEVQALVREALETEGVEHAEAMVATGGWDNEQWLTELLDAHAPAVIP